MKVLSLLQPWASLTVTKKKRAYAAAKGWETRGWKPSEENKKIIQRDGLLIHASKAYRPFQRQLMEGHGSFKEYDLSIQPLVLGAIIGFVTVGEIITTEEWAERHCEPGSILLKEEFRDEFEFGDYRAGRYAWQFKSYQQLPIPVKIAGALSLWDCPNHVLLYIKSQFNSPGH